MDTQQTSLPPNTTPMDGTMWGIQCYVATTNPNDLYRLLCVKDRHNPGLLLRAGFKLLRYCVHSFTPEGHTRMDLLAESHFAWHTFPETGWTYVEITSCIKEKRDRLLELMWANSCLFHDISTSTKLAPPTRILTQQEAR